MTMTATTAAVAYRVADYLGRHDCRDFHPSLASALRCLRVTRERRPEVPGLRIWGLHLVGTEWVRERLTPEEWRELARLEQRS